MHLTIRSLLQASLYASLNLAKGMALLKGLRHKLISQNSCALFS